MMCNVKQNFSSRFLSKYGPYTLVMLIVLSLITVLMSVSLNLDVEILRSIVLYMSTALIQAYAALIAIPFTIAVVHLQSRYGFIAIEFLFRYLRRVFLILGVIFMASFLIIIATSINTHKWGPKLVYLSLIMLVNILLLPLPFIVNYVRSIFTLRPSDMVDFLLEDKITKNSTRTDTIDYNRLREGLSKAFLLAGLCILDPSLEPELSEVIEKISNFLNKVVIHYIKKASRNSDEESNERKLIRSILGFTSQYIVEYLKHSKAQRPLIGYEHLHPLIDVINDIMRIAILKGLIVHEYCYFVCHLQEMMSLYIEAGRINDVEKLYRYVHYKLLESENDILNLRYVQEIMLKNPKNYSDGKLLPREYDFYIDYVATIPCTLFKVLSQKFSRGDLKAVRELLFTVLIKHLNYPILLAGYTFNEHGCGCSSNCADSIVKLILGILKHDNVYGPHLLAILIAWIIRAYIVAENILNDDDKEQVVKNIRALVNKLLGQLSKLGKAIYVDRYPSGELKIMIEVRSVSLSRYIYIKEDVFAELISRYNSKEVCKAISDLLELKTQNC